MLSALVVLFAYALMEWPAWVRFFPDAIVGAPRHFAIHVGLAGLLHVETIATHALT